MSNLSTAPAVDAVGLQTAAHNAAAILSTGRARIIRATNADAPAIVGLSAPSSPTTPGPVTYHSTGVQTLPPPNFDAFVEIHGRKPTNAELERKAGLAGLGRYPTADAHEHRYGPPVQVQQKEKKATYVDSGFQSEGSHRTRTLAVMKATVKAARVASDYRTIVAQAGFNIIAETRVDHVVHSEQYPCDIQLDDLGNVKNGGAVKGRFLPNVSREYLATQSAPPIPPVSWRPGPAWEPENGMPPTQIASVRPSPREGPPKPAPVVDVVPPPPATLGIDGRPIRAGELAYNYRIWQVRTQGLLNVQSWEIGDAEEEAMERYEAYEEDPFSSFVIPSTPLPPCTVAPAPLRKRKSSADHHDTTKESSDIKRARQIAPRQVAPRKQTRPATQTQQQQVCYTNVESQTPNRSPPSPTLSTTDHSPARTSDSGYDTREEDADQVVVTAKNAIRAGSKHHPETCDGSTSAGHKSSESDRTSEKSRVEKVASTTNAIQVGSNHYPKTRDGSTPAGYKSSERDRTSDKVRVEKTAPATRDNTTRSPDVMIEKDTVNTESDTTSLSRATQADSKHYEKPTRGQLSRSQIDAKLHLKAQREYDDILPKDVTSRERRAAKPPTAPKKYEELKMYVPPTRQAREATRQARAQALETPTAPSSSEPAIDISSAAKVQGPIQELMMYVPLTRRAREATRNAKVQGQKIEVLPTVPRTSKATDDTSSAKYQDTIVDSQAGAQAGDLQPVLERGCEAKDRHPETHNPEKEPAPRGQNKRSIEDALPSKYAENLKRLKTDVPQTRKAETVEENVEESEDPQGVGFVYTAHRKKFKAKVPKADISKVAKPETVKKEILAPEQPKVKAPTVPKANILEKKTEPIEAKSIENIAALKQSNTAAPQAAKAQTLATEIEEPTRPISQASAAPTVDALAKKTETSKAANTQSSKTLQAPKQPIIKTQQVNTAEPARQKSEAPQQPTKLEEQKATTPTTTQTPASRPRIKRAPRPEMQRYVARGANAAPSASSRNTTTNNKRDRQDDARDDDCSQERARYSK
jgi:hypothetical protein